MNKKIMKAAGFEKEIELVEQKKCPFCKNPVNTEDFKDALSKKEYGISGLCQKCQDSFFN